MRVIMAAAIVGMVLTVAQAQVVKEQISIQHGQQAILQFTEPFSSASVGNPEVLDALPRSDRILVVAGKQPGITDILIFIDGRPLRHVAVTITPNVAAGKVLTHNKKSLSEYTAYSCNPACARMKDDFEGTDVILFGPGGAAIGVTTTGSSIRTTIPPPR